MAELAVLQCWNMLESFSIRQQCLICQSVSISFIFVSMTYGFIWILNLVISIYLNILSSGYNPLFLPTFDLDVEALCTLGGPGGSATVEVLPAGALRPPVQYFFRPLFGSLLDHI